MTFNNKGLMSSDSIEWHTPQYVVEWSQHRLFSSGHIFSLDVASTDLNKKAPSNYTIEDNGLIKPWFGHVWLNPPYGRTINDWILKSLKEITKENSNCNSITLLIPARSDTRWFFSLVNNKIKKHIIFIKGRLKFSGKSAAPFPSVIVHLLPSKGETTVSFESIPKPPRS